MRCQVTSRSCSWIRAPLFQNQLRVAWHRRYRVPRPCSRQPRLSQDTTEACLRKRRDDPPAPKYCFLSTCTIHSDHEIGAVGVVFAFDKRPDVSKHVEDVAAQFAKDTGMRVSEADLTVFQECPQEVSDHVYVQLFESPCTESDIQRIIKASVDTGDDDEPEGGGGNVPKKGGGGGPSGPSGPSNGGSDGPGGVIRTSFPKLPMAATNWPFRSILFCVL